MPTVADLTAAYGNVLLAPRRGVGVCATCCNLTDGYERCYACAHGGRWLDVVVPISYSVAGEQLHHALSSYKRGRRAIADRFATELAAVLWRFLSLHEACAARAAAVAAFPVVTTVPSNDRVRDDAHPLHRLVGRLCRPTATRYRRLLVRSARPAKPHRFSVDRYEPVAPLRDEPVLLIDDTWTTGANAQSAAAALKAAGAGPVAAVVIGRHLNRGWGPNDRRLNGLPTPFDWSDCVRCKDADPVRE
jgi:predicted amidophosphoribosyltransferase